MNMGTYGSIQTLMLSEFDLILYQIGIYFFWADRNYFTTYSIDYESIDEAEKHFYDAITSKYKIFQIGKHANI